MRWTPYVLSLPALMLFAGVVVVPLAMTVALSFHDWGQYKGIEPVFILKNWREVLEDSYYYEVFGRTFRIAVTVTLLSALFGYLLEWAFTLLFLVEYVLRLLSVAEPLRYARSFFGVVDLLAIVPSFLSFLVPGSQELIVVRAVRLLRIFRVLKLSEYNLEARHLVGALRGIAKPKVLRSHLLRRQRPRRARRQRPERRHAQRLGPDVLVQQQLQLLGELIVLDLQP